MKLNITFGAIAALFLVAGTAQAQTAQNAPRGYAELGYSWVEFKGSGISVKPTAVRGIVGYSFHPNFAAEGMAAFGASSDSTLGVNVKIRNAYGVFVKPQVQVDRFELFARLGWVHQSIRVSAGPFSATDSDSDFAWGVGANYNFTQRVYGSLDYMRFNSGSGRNDAVTLGVGYRF